MTLVPVTLNYDTEQRIGHVILDDTYIPNDTLNDCVLAPKLAKRDGEDTWEVVSFGLIRRTEVDTRPRVS